MPICRPWESKSSTPDLRRHESAVLPRDRARDLLAGGRGTGGAGGHGRDGDGDGGQQGDDDERGDSGHGGVHWRGGAVPPRYRDLEGPPVASLAVPPPTSAALASFPRELLRNLTLRELRGKYKRSTLGYLWSVVNPAVNLAIYTIVFGVFLDVRPPVGDPSGLEMYGFFLVAALLPWSFLTNSLTGSVGAMVGNEGLIKKVYFPRWVLPASVILSFVVGFLVELAVLAVAFSFVGNVVLEFIPVILVLVVLELGFALGIGLALSVANVYFRDIEHFLGILLNVWFYATPILYPITQVPEETELFGYEIPMRSIVEANPMAGFAEAFRDCFYELRGADARHARHPHRLGRRVPPPGGAWCSAAWSRAWRRSCDLQPSR